MLLLPGSVLKENRTVFVADFGGSTTEDDLRKEFTVFGPVVQIRVFPKKSIAFIQFQWRTSAEFAKEAMNNQVIAGAVVSARWAKEDPNPKKVAEAAAARAAYALRVVEETTPVGPVWSLWCIYLYINYDLCSFVHCESFKVKARKRNIQVMMPSIIWFSNILALRIKLVHMIWSSRVRVNPCQVTCRRIGVGILIRRRNITITSTLKQVPDSGNNQF
mmetsp:Transcript_42693/g.96626  ORF Transcript_42693/g.96626 Transcript_42693/m.96626 type:complete len:218 (+) Transcript_42693:552-1205(+)